MSDLSPDVERGMLDWNLRAAGEARRSRTRRRTSREWSMILTWRRTCTTTSRKHHNLGQWDESIVRPLEISEEWIG